MALEHEAEEEKRLEEVNGILDNLVAGLKYEGNTLHCVRLGLALVPPATFIHVSDAKAVRVQWNKLSEIPASVCSLSDLEVLTVSRITGSLYCCVWKNRLITYSFLLLRLITTRSSSCLEV